MGVWVEGQDQPNADWEEIARRYQALFDLAPTPTAVFDMHGRCWLCNHAFSVQLGYDRKRIQDGELCFKDLFTAPDQAHAMMDEILEREVVRRRELVLKDSDGQAIPVLLSGRKLRKGSRPGFEVALTDISRQKELERAFRRDHARLTSLKEGLSAGLFLVNHEGVITEANQALTNILGLKDRNFIGVSYHVFLGEILMRALEPEVLQQTLRMAVIAVARHPQVEAVLNGDRLLHLEIKFFPVWDDQGRSRGWGGLVQDVTEMRDRLAWKLELLSILAHDLRTPLATLKGHTTALLANFRSWDDALNQEFLIAMDQTTDQLVRQVDRSLALTRVEAGRLGLRPEAVHPDKIVRQSLERAAGVLSEVSIKQDIPGDLPQVRVDPARMEEVLINLLDNAVRYAPQGRPIEISAQVAGPMLRMQVRDYGPGVPDGDKQIIFEKYARDDTSSGGTGLGLFIARRIVEAHGGRIWVEDAVDGPGAVFMFTMPIMPETADLPDEALVSSDYAIQAPVDGKRVLVVEDDPNMQALLRSILRDAGYEVEAAPDGPSAVDLFQTCAPDLVLLDWMLPGMNGLLVCRSLRRWSNVPILLLTSKTSQENLVAALDAGADDYVTKPFQAAELLARMRALLRRGEASQPLVGEERFRSKELLIDFNSRQVWLRGEAVNLTPTEHDLLTYLVHHPGQVLTYAQMIDHLWGEDRGRTRHDLFVHISRLRKKIESDPKNPEFVRTRWGVGYLFPAR